MTRHVARRTAAAARTLIAGLPMAAAALLAPAAQAAPTLTVSKPNLSVFERSYAGAALGRGRDSGISVSGLAGNQKASITLGGADAAKFALTCDYADDESCIPVNANATAEATATLTTAGSGAEATATIADDVGTVESVYFSKTGSGYVSKPTEVRIVGACNKPGPDGVLHTADDLRNQTAGPDGIKGTADDCEGVLGRLSFTLSSSGSVDSVTVNNGGKNHISTPRVEIVNHGSVGGSGFAATVTTSSTTTAKGIGVHVTGVTITSAGTGYHEPASLSITGGGSGSGLSLVKPIVDDDVGIYGSASSASCTNAHPSESKACLDIDIEGPGSGYTAIPSVTVVGGGGSGAEVTVIVKSSGVESINFHDDNPKFGTGYDQDGTTVTIAAPPAGPGARRATARAVVADSGSITSVTMVDNGAGYLEPPEVTFESFVGVKTITVTDGKEGSGYTKDLVPKVTISGPTSSAGTKVTATAKAVVATDGSITITLVNPGKGYTTAPTVTIAAPTLEEGVTTATVTLRTKLGQTYVAGTVYNVTVTVKEGSSTAGPKSIRITGRAGSGSGGGPDSTGPTVENRPPEFAANAALAGLVELGSNHPSTWICNRSQIRFPAAIDPDGTGPDSKIEYHISVLYAEAESKDHGISAGQWVTHPKSTWVNRYQYHDESRPRTDAATRHAFVRSQPDSQWTSQRYFDIEVDDVSGVALYLVHITPRDTASPKAYGQTRTFTFRVEYNRAGDNATGGDRWGDNPGQDIDCRNGGVLQLLGPVGDDWETYKGEGNELSLRGASSVKSARRPPLNEVTAYRWGFDPQTQTRGNTGGNLIAHNAFTGDDLQYSPRFYTACGTEDEQRYWIHNIGGKTLRITGNITVSGQDAAAFTIVQPKKKTVEKLAEFTEFSIKFAPINSGRYAHEAVITIPSSGPQPAYKFGIQGTTADGELTYNSACPNTDLKSLPYFTGHEGKPTSVIGEDVRATNGGTVTHTVPGVTIEPARLSGKWTDDLYVVQDFASLPTWLSVSAKSGDTPTVFTAAPTRDQTGQSHTAVVHVYRKFVPESEGFGYATYTVTFHTRLRASDCKATAVAIGHGASTTTGTWTGDWRDEQDCSVYTFTSGYLSTIDIRLDAGSNVPTDLHLYRGTDVTGTPYATSVKQAPNAQGDPTQRSNNDAHIHLLHQRKGTWTVVARYANNLSETLYWRPRSNPKPPLPYSYTLTVSAAGDPSVPPIRQDFSGCTAPELEARNTTYAAGSRTGVKAAATDANRHTITLKDNCTSINSRGERAAYRTIKVPSPGVGRTAIITVLASKGMSMFLIDGPMPTAKDRQGNLRGVGHIAKKYTFDTYTRMEKRLYHADGDTWGDGTHRTFVIEVTQISLGRSPRTFHLEWSHKAECTQCAPTIPDVNDIEFDGLCVEEGTAWTKTMPLATGGNGDPERFSYRVWKRGTNAEFRENGFTFDPTTRVLHSEHTGDGKTQVSKVSGRKPRAVTHKLTYVIHDADGDRRRSDAYHRHFDIQVKFNNTAQNPLGGYTDGRCTNDLGTEGPQNMGALPPNQPPGWDWDVLPFAPPTGAVGVPWRYTLPAAVDPDGDTSLTYKVKTVQGQQWPSWLTWNATTRTLSGTPPASGTTTLYAEVTDGHAPDPLFLSVSPPLVIEVAGAGMTPPRVWLPDGEAQSAVAGSRHLVRAYYEDAETPGRDITFAWTQTGGPTVQLTSTTFPQMDFIVPTEVGTSLSFRVTATDGDGMTGSAEVVVTVTAPDAAADAFSFAPVTLAAGAQSYSESVFPGGFDLPLPIAVSAQPAGAEFAYFVGEDESETATTIAPGDELYLWARASTTPDAVVTVTVTLGTGASAVSGRWQVTTQAAAVVTADLRPDGFAFAPVSARGGSEVVSATATLTGFDRAVPLAVSAEPSGAAFGYWAGSARSTTATQVAPDDALQLRAQADTRPGATVTVTATAGAGADAVSAQWVVTTQASPCQSALGAIAHGGGASRSGERWDSPGCRAHHREGRAARYFGFSLTAQSIVTIDLSTGASASLFVSAGTPANGWGTPPGGGMAHRLATRRANGKLVHEGAPSATMLLASGAYTAEVVLDAGAPEQAHTAGAFSLTVRAAAPATVSVADARVEEAPGAVLAFAVTLDRAPGVAAEVAWATSDGSAVAGDDYTAGAGTLSFGAGETRKTIEVAVLDDAHDEGEETMTLTLSAPVALLAGDMTGIGTIANEDPLLNAWLARFGRTVAQHTTDAVSTRLAMDAEAGSHVTIAGRRIDLGAPREDAEALDDAPAVPPEQEAGLRKVLEALAGAGDGHEADSGWSVFPGETREPAETRITGRELALGSAFHLTGGGDASGRGPGGAARWSAWGRAATGRFESRGDEVPVEGEVVTGVLGADREAGRWLAGVAVTHSVSDGTMRPRGMDIEYAVESTMTALNPYVRVALTERFSAWGLAGRGTGGLTLTSTREERASTWRTDIDMTLAAVGARGTVLEPGEDGDFGLAVRSDAFWVRTTSEAVHGVTGLGNLVAARGDASRVRVILDGSRPIALAGDRTLTPSLALGVRWDAGDAETGAGLELGAGVAWEDPARGVNAELRARTLAAHAESGYREWGLSGAFTMGAGDAGRGLSITVTPAFGADTGPSERLWSASDAVEFAPDGAESDARGRIETEVGYGLAAFGGRYTGTPYAALGAGGGERRLRVGWRLAGAGEGQDLSLTVEAGRREPAGGGEPEHRIGLSLGTRW